ncbi:MAG: sensor histidine kinase [Thermoleophilia bacterium]
MTALGVTRPAPRSWVTPRRRVALEVLVAAVYGGAAWALLRGWDAPASLAVPAALAAGLALALAGRRPRTALTLALAGFAACPWWESVGFVALIPTAVALGCTAASRGRWGSAPWLGLALLGPVAAGIPGHPGVIAPFALCLAAGWFGGVVWGEQRRYREDVAAAGLHAQRVRIARDLHDVLAHGVGLITVQAGYANLVAGERPEAAREALGVIERTGRETLADVRRLVATLRDGVEEAGPSPGLDDIPRLVDDTRRAGVTVTARCAAPDHPLPASLQLCAYRVVQEALTNVVRHAPGATVRVCIEPGASELRVSVTDDGGRPREAGREGPGHGLIGMRERVALQGGTLVTRPGEHGGFEVLARLPHGSGA